MVAGRLSEMKDLLATGATLRHSKQNPCKQLWRNQRLSDSPAGHNTHIIVDNNKEAATKSTYLWNKLQFMATILRKLWLPYCK